MQREIKITACPPEIMEAPTRFELVFADLQSAA